MFVLYTDASGDAIGAELSQIQEGMEKPIAYRSLSSGRDERKYCTTRNGLLAVVRLKTSGNRNKSRAGDLPGEDDLLLIPAGMEGGSRSKRRRRRDHGGKRKVVWAHPPLKPQEEPARRPKEEPTRRGRSHVRGKVLGAGGCGFGPGVAW
jgi:hypothetical protein